MLFSRAHGRGVSTRLRVQSRCKHHAAATTRHDGLNAVINRGKEPGEGNALETASGILQGRRVAVKDNIDTAELPTTAASKFLRNYKSPFAATVVELLREHGAQIHQTTNLDEFGMGSHSQASEFGPALSLYTRNGVPLSPGGSSGGSAVAVATGDAWAALGTDTGGSVRLPAAYTGTVGFKPSYGMLSRWGVIQYANSLDTVGIIGQKVQAVRDMFSVLSKHDKNDPTSLPSPLRQRLATTTTTPSRSLRIGVPTDYNIQELSPLVRQTWSRTLSSLQTQGHSLHPISLPQTNQALSAYYVLAPAEASSNLAKYDGIRYGTRPSGPDASPTANSPLYARTRGENFGPEVQRRILLGAYTLSSEAKDNYFIQAQKVRRMVQSDFDRVFARRNPLFDTSRDSGVEAGVDVVVTPTAPTLPPTVEEVGRLSPVEVFMNDVFTVPASLAGLPAVSVPVGLDKGVREGMDEGDVRSVGLQVIGQFGDDGGVLAAAEVIERLNETLVA
ncbi:hypothetical protein MBLNU230_g4203t1 [Neophaeotheca triangularis]